MQRRRFESRRAVQACDLAAGQACHEGKCGSACSVAADKPSNVGCEFWAVDLDQQDGASDPASMPWGVALSNAGQSQANVTIELNEAAPGQPVALKVVKQVSILPGALEAVVLPTRELDCGVKPNDYTSPGTCLSSKAYRITSSYPIIAYQFNVFANAFSNDASLLLPTTALGKWHRVIGWNAGHPVLIDFPGLPKIIDRSYVTIVGTKPNTTVKVRPSWRIRGNPPIAATAPGGEIVANLGPFDVLNLETDDATMGEDQKTMADLTGTVVESNQPVAVFSGVESTSAPGWLDVPKPPGWTSDDTCCLDHLEEQIFPVESVGSKYVVARSPVRSTGGFKEPDVIRFLGVAETANVTTTLPSPYDKFTLQPGEVVTTWAQADFTVSSDKPVMVAQILISGEYLAGAYTGDPSLTIIPPGRAVPHGVRDHDSRELDHELRGDHHRGDDQDRPRRLGHRQLPEGICGHSGRRALRDAALPVEGGRALPDRRRALRDRGLRLRLGRFLRLRRRRRRETHLRSPADQVNPRRAAVAPPRQGGQAPRPE